MTLLDISEQSYKNGMRDGIARSGIYMPADCDCVKNAKVFGLEDSIRRSKFPMAVDISSLSDTLTNTALSLAQSERGAGHDQWLTGVIVQFDLTFTIKAWVEAERYHFFDFVSSQSTMHRIAEFPVERQVCKYVDNDAVALVNKKLADYKHYEAKIRDLKASGVQDDRLKSVQEEKAEAYLRLLYNTPVGFMLTAGMTTNYRQLKTIYAQRKAHRLPEWRAFCKWIETLPHSELITGKKETNA